MRTKSVTRMGGKLKVHTYERLEGISGALVGSLKCVGANFNEL